MMVWRSSYDAASITTPVASCSCVGISSLDFDNDGSVEGFNWHLTQPGEKSLALALENSKRNLVGNYELYLYPLGRGCYRPSICCDCRPLQPVGPHKTFTNTDRAPV